MADHRLRGFRRGVESAYRLRPYHCPKCGSNDICAYGNPVVVGEQSDAEQRVVCGTCKAVWFDIYKLVGIRFERKEDST